MAEECIRIQLDLEQLSKDDTCLQPLLVDTTDARAMYINTTPSRLTSCRLPQSGIHDVIPSLMLSLCS